MKKSATKRALLMSVVSILLCISMLIGTTMAWFTDTATTGCSVIKSGTLDIVLEYWDGDSWEDAEGEIIPFVTADGREQSQILWEPGCTYKMAPFRVRNVGNLNTKILIMLNGVTGDEKLMEAIELKTGINNIPQSVLDGSAGNQLQKFVHHAACTHRQDSFSTGVTVTISKKRPLEKRYISMYNIYTIDI